MDENKLCECGCGGEVKMWNNGRHSPFLRGHHMRKKGWSPLPSGPHYCACGCGTEILPLRSGFVSKYVKGHHLKGVRLNLEYRMERTRNRWGREPTLSPYLKDTFLSQNKKTGRWYACVKRTNGRYGTALHSNAVYQQCFGEIPTGYVVHHKDGRCQEIHDDRPDNLMLLPDEWNLRFFPVLAKGFGVKEKVVTDCYIRIFKENAGGETLFALLCNELIQELAT